MIDLPSEWFPDHDANGQITPNGQAKGYPYPAPEGDFWMRDGLPVLCPQGITEDECQNRTPVLSVGSNRAPLQLRRKFGPRATLPVTSAKLHDCDIVYAATMSYYCAVPATAFPSPGTVVTLNIAWLDDDQLDHMHATEALGVAYDFVRLDEGLIDHGNRQDAPVFNQPVYGYQSRSPMMALDHAPVAHAMILAEGRRFRAMDQGEMLDYVKSRTGYDHMMLDDWLEHLRQDKTNRLKIMDMLAADGIALGEVPWQVVTAKAKDIDRYL
jgi:hypothetical protein